ncbi:tyrosine-type recombinase/integrase [Aeromicrobium sp.]|uniref:tyrosine-type recombinase/integrase n=1 Tax=Aeromicrobium sp. TaxID=1871063 RepID=UPI00345B4784
MILRPISGNPIDRHDACRMVARIAKAARIFWHIGPHLLRRAVRTNALDAGVPLSDAQILARHAEPRTTQHYDRARGNLIGSLSTSSPLMSPESEPQVSVLLAHRGRPSAVGERDPTVRDIVLFPGQTPVLGVSTSGKRFSPRQTMRTPTRPPVVRDAFAIGEATKPRSSSR